MRLLLKLKSEKNCCYDQRYYHKARGFLYNLQKNSKSFNRHELPNYKFFCYSNIFPIEDMKEGETRTFIVSSPDRDFIYWLRGRLTEMQELKKKAEIGEMQFTITDVKSFSPKIGRNASLITGTPIVVRIPKENYGTYGIESKRPYEYWRPEYDFNAFLKQVTDNLLKKYKEYHGKEIKEESLFQDMKFKKSVCVHRVEEGQERETIGSTWEFKFNNLNKKQRRLLHLGLESGFGELNSSGFGFMNVV